MYQVVKQLKQLNESLNQSNMIDWVAQILVLRKEDTFIVSYKSEVSKSTRGKLVNTFSCLHTIIKC